MHPQVRTPAWNPHWRFWCWQPSGVRRAVRVSIAVCGERAVGNIAGVDAILELLELVQDAATRTRIVDKRLRRRIARVPVNRAGDIWSRISFDRTPGAIVPAGLWRRAWTG